MVSLVAPCRAGASGVSVRRGHFHHRLLGTLAMAAFTIVMATGTAFAQPAPCRALLDPFFQRAPGGQPFLASMLAFRTTARGEDGFVSFSVHERYEVARRPFHTGTGGQVVFLSAGPDGTLFSGRFGEYFPGDDRPRTDSTSVAIARTGGVSLTFHTWGNTRAALTDLVCYRGATGQVMITGSSTTATHGTDRWSFLLTRVDPASIPF